MMAGVIAAVIGSVAFALAAVLQSMAAEWTARREAAEQRAAAPANSGGTATATTTKAAKRAHPSLRSTARTMIKWPFLLGLFFDVIGFGATILSARLIPLFLSQSIIAARLVVTAVLAMVILHVSLRTRDWFAGTVVIAALVLLAVGAGPEGTRNEQWMHWATLVATFVLFGLGLVLMRVLHKHIASATGLVAGAMFGVMAVASRVLHGLSPFSASHLLTDPALYGLAFSGILGFYLFTVALQTGSVNGAAAALVVGETVIPGAIGILLLGDTITNGWEIPTTIAFIAAVIGGVIVSSSSAVQAVEHAEAAAYHHEHRPRPLESAPPRAALESGSDHGTGKD
ncbi:DMT family transporter [Gordonia sp. L191]|uniref:DMT family transporter n=1 Tax=Gordonia oryzae TaxID=2487349 RepID=A0A3N4G9R8_9ACTN|nr:MULTISPECIES: DMT family transporter [Gordonia]RPA59492.1 DMT family transporter [Gordonia oryzae]WHU46642.1 DMT family transporter [Gordonia sp. L191]